METFFALLALFKGNESKGQWTNSWIETPVIWDAIALIITSMLYIIIQMNDTRPYWWKVNIGSKFFKIFCKLVGVVATSNFELILVTDGWGISAKLPSIECYRSLLVISQLWFMWCLKTIIRADAYPALCRHMALLDHNQLNLAILSFPRSISLLRYNHWYCQNLIKASIFSLINIQFRCNVIFISVKCV